MGNQTEYEEINPSTWTPKEVGDSVEGKLINKRTNVGVNESNAYDIEAKDGQVMVWGSAVLDQRLEYINVGEMVRITYKGLEKNSKGQDTKIFKVEKEKDLSEVEAEDVE